MFDIFRPTPRRVDQLASEGVQIQSPIPMPPPDTRPAWERFMPLGMALMMIAMLSLMVVMMLQRSGSSGMMTMIYRLPMMVMMVAMMVMMSMGMRGGGGSGNDIDGEMEEYDLQLREDRALIHQHGRAMHDLRTTCFPHPYDLTSLVGSDQMWQADPDPNIGRVIPPEDESDPDVKHLTANPFLRPRIGIGVAPLYPKLKPAEDVVPEMLEPGTKVRYHEAMNTLSVVANLPMDATLAEYPAYAMRGDEQPRLALVRAMLMSLAFNHRPDHLNIGLITDDPDSWQWMKWLPHTEDMTKVEKGMGARLLTWRSIDEFAARHAKQLERLRSDDPDKPPHLLVVVDLPEQSVDWPVTMPGGVPGMTWLVVRYGIDHVSEVKSRILLRDGRVSTYEDFDAAAADQVSLEVADTFARAMYRYRPRGYGSGAVADDTPDHIPDFFEALGIADIETHDIVKVWKENAYTDELKVPYGYRRNGDELTPQVTSLNLYEVNRHGDGPHGAVAGQTGSGKSYFLKCLVLALCAKYGPDKLALLLADFKGGATFLGMKGVPHVVASISNLESATELVERLGAILQGELIRRETYMTEERGCKDIFEYREKQRTRQGDPDWLPMPDLVIIIDECGQFLKDRPDYLKLLTEIGRVGRSLGIHLIICSQFIDKTMVGDLLEHLLFRFSLSVQSPQYSVAMIGTDAAANMVAGKLKGKIIRKFQKDSQPVEVVSFHHEAEYVRRTKVERARITDESPIGDAVSMFDLFADRDFTPVVEGEVVETKEERQGDHMGEVLLQKVRRLHDMRNPFVATMWSPSLRDPMSLPDLGLQKQDKGLSIRIGDIDVPKKQVRVPWNIEFSGNTPHWTIAGGGKSGRTTLLQTMVICGCLQHEPSRLMFMLADYTTGKLGEVRNAPNVAAFARPGADDVVSRILGEARRLIDVRTDAMVNREVYSVDAYLQSKEREPIAGDPYGYVIVAIDGIGGFLGQENRKEVAERLRPIVDSGPGVGIHLVFTADTATAGTSGNAPHYTTELPGCIQLPAPDYSGSKVPAQIKSTLRGFIPKQPGRSVQVFDAEGGVGDDVVALHARTAVPINREIEPDKIENEREIYEVHDYGEEIAALCGQLRNTYAEQIVPPVTAAPAATPYADMWSAFAPMVDMGRNPRYTIHPLGWDTDTLALAPVPNYSQNLMVYGETGCGKTNALRVIMESVMRQFTPETASIIVIDPLRNMLGERDELYRRGFMRPAKNSEPDEHGEVTQLRPPGYVTSADDINATADMLVRLMGSRRPTNETTGDQLRDRTYFTGPEVYVFVDNFVQIAEGYALKSAFDQVAVGNQTVAKLLGTGDDLGVHFIVSTDIKFSEQVGSSQFLSALREAMLTPILQLAAPPSTRPPVGGAYHLKPKRWRAGQGRMIVDDLDYTQVQLALIRGD